MLPFTNAKPPGLYSSSSTAYPSSARFPTTVTLPSTSTVYNHPSSSTHQQQHYRRPLNTAASNITGTYGQGLDRYVVRFTQLRFIYLAIILLKLPVSLIINLHNNISNVSLL